MKRIVIVLDASGSMGDFGKRDETISGFNKWLDDQLALPEDGTLVTLIQFNTERTLVYTDKPLKEVPRLARDSYAPAGCTALLDAVAAGATGAAALCLIVTDGEENSSHETTLKQVQDLLETRKKEGWEFHFVGAGPEKWAERTAAQIGTQSSVAFANTGLGIRQAWAYNSSSSASYRAKT